MTPTSTPGSWRFTTRPTPLAASTGRSSSTLPSRCLRAEGCSRSLARRDCQAYFAGLKAQGRAQATLRSRWIALRSFYAWLAEEEEIDTNPMLGVKVERAEPPPPVMPDDGDLKLLLKVCAGKGIWERRDLAMIRVAAATGIRVGELCALQVTDVDLSR